ncbi:MAG: hypothetical protein ACRD2L_04025 [Terriglobia bacterium]
MVSRNWLYSYRILTARLREGAGAPTYRTSGLNGGSAGAQPRSLAVNDEIAEAKPMKPALLLTAGGKM